MKKFILVIVCLAMPYFAPGENIEKVVLVPIDSGAPLNIENLYISPQENDPPLVAFYGEDGANIYVYNTVSRKMRAFQFKIGRSRVEETSFSFVTFCWDLEAYGDFAVIISTTEGRLVFTGSIDGDNKLAGPLTIASDTTGYNFLDGKLFYISLKRNEALVPGGFFFPASLKPPHANQVMVDYKLTVKAEPYFTLRDKINNNNGIYKGKDFEKVVDSADLDEFYPHYSANGNALGYIVRDRQNGSAKVNLKVGNNLGISSSFSFAMDENALLREYSRMYFIGEELYFFKKEPDLNSQSTFGFFKLSTAGVINLKCKEPLIEDTEVVKNAFTGKEEQYQPINEKEKPSLKNIIPFLYKNKLFFVILTTQHKFRMQIEMDGKGSYYPVFTGQIIVIVDSNFVVRAS